MKVNIINRSGHKLPAYETVMSAGMDIRACLDNNVDLLPGERIMIPTGLFMELPEGYEAQIRPRSGLAIRNGITVLNSPGTIDGDYRGEIKVLLINKGNDRFIIEDGERIAQMVIAKFEQVEWNQVDSLSETSRGDGGFGSTGRK